jgi:regulator of cell morphogenesis and NO signaling
MYSVGIILEKVTNMTIEKNTTIGEVAANLPGSVRLFERLQIDYCCGGKRTLEDVCEERQLGLQEVLAALDTIRDVGRGAPDLKDWSTAPLTELTGHIVSKHHSYVRSEVPRVSGLLDRICEVHGENRPEFRKARELWQLLSDELSGHMFKEENILFPYVEQLEASGDDRPLSPPFGSVENPIRMMVHEHETAGSLIGDIQNLFVDRTGCNTCLEFFRSVDTFEKDLHQHIHLENNILFPRAIELEQKRNRSGLR